MSLQVKVVRWTTHWLDRVFSNRGAYFSHTPSLLLWDSYGSHSKDDVKAHLKTKYRSEMILIPKKKTSYAQPLDVGINSPFKNDLKKSWADWFKNSVPVYINAGNRKHPDYETMVEMVVNAMKAVSPEVICSSFKVCGIAPYGQDVPQEELNQRLRMVMSFTPNELISNDDDERIIVDDDQDHDSSCDDDDYEMSEDMIRTRESDLFEGTLLDLEATDVNDDIFLNDLHDDDINVTTQNNTRTYIECNVDVTGSTESVVIEHENNEDRVPRRMAALDAREIIKVSDH